VRRMLKLIPKINGDKSMKSTRPEVATAHSSMHRIDVHKLADEARIRAVCLASRQR